MAKPSEISEFELIARINARLTAVSDQVLVGPGDDAALIRPRAGDALAMSTDTIVESIHFLPGTAPADIGHKALAVNLSDLAAMGATPEWCLLSLCLEQAETEWVDAFCAGFGGLADTHGVATVGGNVSRGPLAVTVTVAGSVTADRPLLRSGARAGDGIYVSGSLGDAAAALRDPGADSEPLQRRQLRPEPRIALGLALRGVASAAIDISDGLVADLGHLLTASGVGAELDLDSLPLSAELHERFDAGAARMLALTGGEDYELCFAVPPGLAAGFGDGAFAGVAVTRIGTVVADKHYVGNADGLGLNLRVLAEESGFRHF